MSAAASAQDGTRRGTGRARRSRLSADGAALVVEDLSVGYHQKDGGVLRVVANVDLKLFPGQVLGLAGESGCGKSTAALAAVGYRHPGGVILSRPLDCSATPSCCRCGRPTLRLLVGRSGGVHLTERRRCR